MPGSGSNLTAEPARKQPHEPDFVVGATVDNIFLEHVVGR
jgi:hypothetical protein